MKYVITGAAGHTSRPIALGLLNAGQEVTVVGRHPENLRELTDKGAHAAIGTIEDLEFLKSTFKGADAVYTLVPPNMASTDWKGFIGETGKRYAEAIRASNVRYVVNLSSVGGHMKEGAGPVSGLHRVEEALNHLSEVNILHLRPGFFYENLLSNIKMVKGMNIMGGNYGAEMKMVFVSPADIAAVALEELLGLRFKGHSVRYISSDERTTAETARILGQAVGKPDLPWVEFSDEQTISGMIQAGLPREVAENYTEMGRALRTGEMVADYWKQHPAKLGNTKLEDFARTFAAVYQAN
jgi:uncharacterized protein YbjT (DUF2867 family)